MYINIFGLWRVLQDPDLFKPFNQCCTVGSTVCRGSDIMIGAVISQCWGCDIAFIVDSALASVGYSRPKLGEQEWRILGDEK